MKSLLLFFINYLGSCKLELEVFKKAVELMQLNRVNLQSSVVSMGGTTVPLCME